MATLHTIARIRIVTNQRLAGNASESGRTRFLAIADVTIIAVEGLTREATNNRVTVFCAVAGV
jgi:hypothetical protein